MKKNEVNAQKDQEKHSHFGASLSAVIAITEFALGFIDNSTPEGNRKLGLVLALITLGIALIGIVALYFLGHKAEGFINLLVSVCSIVLLIIMCFLAFGDNKELPQIHVYQESMQDGFVQLGANVEPSGYKIEWSSSNENIATVSQMGEVTAVSSGTVRIVATIIIGGEAYSDSLMMTVAENQGTTEFVRVRFLGEEPMEMENWPTSGYGMLAQNNIYISEQDARNFIESKNGSNCEVIKSEVIGFVYYHWCRGDNIPYDDPEKHNRTSGATEGSHWSNKLEEYVECHSFSSFFDSSYLSTHEMKFAEDNSNSIWFENYYVCHDSYWYWPVPVYETEYLVNHPLISISISE